MRYTQIILLYLAGFILCLHTLVLHSHKGEVVSQDEINFELADSFTDWVKVLFLVDQGEGHLDNFESADGSIDMSAVLTVSSIDIEKFVAISTELFTDIEHKDPILIRNSLDPPDSHLIKVTALRGPPSSFLG